MGAYQSRGTNLQIKDKYILEIKYTDNLYSVMIIVNSTTYVRSVYFSPPLACQGLAGSNHDLSQHITPYLVHKRCSKCLLNKWDHHTPNIITGELNGNQILHCNMEANRQYWHRSDSQEALVFILSSYTDQWILLFLMMMIRLEVLANAKNAQNVPMWRTFTNLY